MAKEPDCGFEVSEIELQMPYSVHFRKKNSVEKDMNIFIPPVSALNSFTAVLLQGWISH